MVRRWMAAALWLMLLMQMAPGWTQQLTQGLTQEPPPNTPRHRLRLAANPFAADGGSVRFAGAASAILHYRGLTVISVADDMPPALPDADLVLLSRLPEPWLAAGGADGTRAEMGPGLARDTPVAAPPAVARWLRGHGFTRLYELDTWDALEVDKGAARLRLTVMPGVSGAPDASDAAQSLTMLLDFGAGGPGAYRIVIGGAMTSGEVAQIPQRFPGADLALLHLNGSRLLGLVTPEGTLRIRYLPPGEPYPFAMRHQTTARISRVTPPSLKPSNRPAR